VCAANGSLCAAAGSAGDATGDIRRCPSPPFSVEHLRSRWRRHSTVAGEIAPVGRACLPLRRKAQEYGVSSVVRGRSRSTSASHAKVTTGQHGGGGSGGPRRSKGARLSSRLRPILQGPKGRAAGSHQPAHRDPRNADGAAPELHDRSGAAPPWVEAEVKGLFLLLLTLALFGLLLGLSLCCCHLAFLLATFVHWPIQCIVQHFKINIISISGVAGMSCSYTLGVDKSLRNKISSLAGGLECAQEMIGPDE
jgi:hypothetical protein